MKRLFAFAVVLLASSAAQAQYTFDYGGRTIRIDPDRGTVSIPGVYDNSGPRARRSHNDQDINRPRKQLPQQTRVDPQTPDTGAARTEPAPAPANPSPEPSTATANVAPAETPISTQPAAGVPALQLQQDAAPVAAPGPDAGRCNSPGAADTAPATSASHLTDRPLADRGEGGQGPDRALRRRSLRIFRGRQVQPERRTGPDQYEARQGLQMARTHSRPEDRQQL